MPNDFSLKCLLQIKLKKIQGPGRFRIRAIEIFWEAQQKFKLKLGKSHRRELKIRVMATSNVEDGIHFLFFSKSTFSM